jgi:hypothetical protein
MPFITAVCSTSKLQVPDRLSSSEKREYDLQKQPRCGNFRSLEGHLTPGRSEPSDQENSSSADQRSVDRIGRGNRHKRRWSRLLEKYRDVCPRRSDLLTMTACR